jgi:hypothetical protein
LLSVHQGHGPSRAMDRPIRAHMMPLSEGYTPSYKEFTSFILRTCSPSCISAWSSQRSLETPILQACKQFSSTLHTDLVRTSKTQSEIIGSTGRDCKTLSQRREQRRKKACRFRARAASPGRRAKRLSTGRSCKQRCRIGRWRGHPKLALSSSPRRSTSAMHTESAMPGLGSNGPPRGQRRACGCRVSFSCSTHRLPRRLRAPARGN